MIGRAQGRFGAPLDTATARADARRGLVGDDVRCRACSSAKVNFVIWFIAGLTLAHHLLQ